LAGESGNTKLYTSVKYCNENQKFTYYTTGEQTTVNRPMNRKMTYKHNPLVTYRNRKLADLVGLEVAVDMTKTVS
jgi:hypothetical protein